MIISNWQTAESVTEGHPDKICDQISDAILDAYLEQDPMSRVAVESAGGHGELFIMGEVTSKATVDHAAIARKVYQEIGYNEPLKITVNVVAQSPDIAMGVDTGGAGDQGMMYGYATNETSSFLPKPLDLSHKLAKRLTDLRRNDKRFSWLRPDGKTQVTTKNGVVKTVVVSTQHTPDIKTEKLRQLILKELISPIVGKIAPEHCLINPTGHFVLGGFEADTGLTGRKIMVDTYGGLAPQGGGAFSGKDPTKVDRSAAYMARYLAKNIVTSGHANKCLVSFSYAIGYDQPVMVECWTDTSYDGRKWIVKNFDLSPAGIIKFLDLRRPIYRQTAAYGHFGNNQFPWEK